MVLTEAISLTSDGDMYIGIQIVHYAVLRYLDCCHILQSLHLLYSRNYMLLYIHKHYHTMKALSYHESNGSKMSNAECLFNAVLDFRYSSPKKK